MKKKVVVTRRWPEAVEKQLLIDYDVVLNKADKPMSSAELKDALVNADALLTTVTDKVDADVLSTPEIRASIIANYGVGFSHIDIAAAKQRGVVVSNTPDVLNECTADIAMTLMLMVARRAGEGERELRAKQWQGWRPTHMVGSKVSGKTLGIVGYGRIGQAMAKRAHHGFGMNILVHNRSRISSEVLSENAAKQSDSLEALAAECDFLSLHCPGGIENTNLINASILSQMHAGAYLINTARGEVIDENALIEALNNHQIAGAALDVFVNEPNVNPELAASPNLVMLPHLGSASGDTREAMGFRVLDNLQRHFNQESLRDPVIRGTDHN